MSDKTTNTPEPEDRDVLIEGHVYDGIQEYDNPMPGWWLAIFYITIAWSLFYVIGINVGWLNTYQDDLQEQTEWLSEVQYNAALLNPEVTPEYLAEAIESGEFLAVGAAAYTSTCAACHGNNGEGGIGANLTDSMWLHGGSSMDIFQVVDKGVLEKGMPAWGSALTHDKLVGVVSFIESIRNTNVAGKAPEGTEYVPE